jgi:ribosomal protein S18 acetylase RimI-like enzyme
MKNTLAYLIRDGIPADIVPCLDLNHSTQTERVWQMNMMQDGANWQVTFREERLPREVDVTHTPDESRLRLMLAPEACFLVAAGKDDASDVRLGYLTMHIDPVHLIARVHDIVVGREFRRSGIGGRLLRVARAWAHDEGAKRLMLETRTQNYAAIQFCQKNGLSFCGFNDQYFTSQDIAIFFGQSLR